MSPEQKLQALEWSIECAAAGETSIVHCPYCNLDLDFTPPSILQETYDPPTCCAEFALATIAILGRKELQDAKELAERIRDNSNGRAVFN